MCAVAQPVARAKRTMGEHLSRKISVNAASEAIASFTTALHAAIDEAARVAKAPVDRIAEFAHEASDSAVSSGNQAADWLDKGTGQLASKSKDLAGGISACVSAHPFKALGIAALVAVVLGRLTR